MGKIINIKARFLAKVDKTGDCWIWKGARDGDGYGNIGLFQRMKKAHRVSWELYQGPIPEKMQVLHKCDNPPCVNPEHLFLGTISDNAKDAFLKGRRSNRGIKNSRSKINLEQANQIRKEYVKYVNSFKKLAEKFGISKSSVADIIYGRHWQDQ